MTKFIQIFLILFMIASIAIQAYFTIHLYRCGDMGVIPLMVLTAMLIYEIKCFVEWWRGDTE